MTTELTYTPKELAALWRVSDATIRHLFRGRPGVMRIPGPSGRYVSLRIPLSVADAVRRELSVDQI